MSTEVRFGWLADQRLPWQAMLARTIDVERLGYGSVWLSDHLFDESNRWLLDCWTSAAALLAAVPRIEVGTLVAANTLRHPALTAHMAHTAAQIAPARFVLGLGAGGSAEEHRAIGVPFPDLAERTSRLDDACALLRTAKGSSPAAFDGNYYRLPACGAQPDAATDPLPILVGGASQRVLDIAARHADRWTIWADPETAAARREALAASCAASNRDIADIRCGAIAMMIPEHLPNRFPDESWPATLAGNADQMLELVECYADAGIEDVVVCEFAIAPDRQHEALVWFAENVVET